MKKLIVAVFAALAMIGCTPDKAEKAAAPPPQPVQTAPTPPAPQPVVRITVMAETAMCKNDWAKSWAEEHNTTVAAAERHARRMPATTPSWTYAGKTVTFTKTVWDSCEAAIKEERAAKARATAPAPTDPNMVTVTRQHYNELRGLAYQNPLESDPAKLVPYQPQVADLERRLEEAQRPITTTTIIVASIIGLTGIGLGMLIGARLWRRRSNRTLGS